jgi:hypothetical protein
MGLDGLGLAERRVQFDDLTEVERRGTRRVRLVRGEGHGVSD